ncbi:MAG TPA: glycosyltransferase family 4 protein [Opitutus sp.]|nr:glycosyltransferase family 4 protein [Opitutus sp.]
MNVLLVIEPGIDGVFRYVEALAHFLVARDVRVHLAYSDRRGSDALARLVDFVRAHRGATLNLRVANRPEPRTDWRALRALRTLVAEIQPDLIHSHSSKAGVLARLLPFCGLRVPHVYNPHAYAGMRPQSRGLRFFYDAIEAGLGRFGVTLTCSEDELDYARRRLRLPATRALYVPNGVDTRLFTPPAAAEKLALREAFGLPPHACILGTVGRTAPQKDPLTLYHAFARAHAIEPGLVLFHLGTGELDGELHRFVQARRLQGVIVRRAYLDRTADFYRAIDGFILPSLYEGLALSALEALSCNLPVILSDAPGNRTLLKLRFNQMQSAPAGDVLAFSRAIVGWARACRSATTPNHRLLILEGFDQSVCFARVLDLYRLLLARAPAGAPRRAAPWTPAAGGLAPARVPRRFRPEP